MNDKRTKRQERRHVSPLLQLPYHDRHANSPVWLRFDRERDTLRPFTVSKRRLRQALAEFNKNLRLLTSGKQV